MAISKIFLWMSSLDLKSFYTQWNFSLTRHFQEGAFASPYFYHPCLWVVIWESVCGGYFNPQVLTQLLSNKTFFRKSGIRHPLPFITPWHHAKNQKKEMSGFREKFMTVQIDWETDISEFIKPDPFWVQLHSDIVWRQNLLFNIMFH